jgi:hypothetical protein
LYQQIDFSGLVALWKFYVGNLNLKAVGLPAPDTFEVNMIVVMAGEGASLST